MVEKKVKHEIVKALPDHRYIAETDFFASQLNLLNYREEECVKFDALVTANETGGLISRYPVRETEALNDIASGLGFRTPEKYEMAVRKMLVDDEEARNAAEDLFGSMAAVLNV